MVLFIKLTGKPFFPLTRVIMKTILAASIFFIAAQGAFAQTAANPVKWMAQDLKSQQCDVNLKQTKIIKGNLPGLGP